jgi:integrase
MTKAKARDDGDGSAYRIADGRWRAAVTIGWETAPDGKRKRIRKYVTRPTEAQAKAARKELLRQRDRGELIDRPDVTVRSWLAYWLDVVCVERELAPATLASYRGHVKNWIVPTIGDIKLTDLQPEHPERVYRRMRDAGLAGSTVLGAHRVLSRALKVATRRGRTYRNVCDLIDAPTASKGVVETSALDGDDARRVLAAAAGTWNSARWSVALAIGLRQSEALGLTWQRVDLEASSVTIAVQLYRSYGGSGVALRAPKSAGSKRVIRLPEELVRQLRAHRRRQQETRLQLGPGWVGSPLGDLVFARPDGRHIDHSDDWEAWGDLLDASGVRYVRLHDARHTAATMMLAQKISPRVVQHVLGHSTIALTLGTYSHVLADVAEEAAAAMDAALWGDQLPIDRAATRAATTADNPGHGRKRRRPDPLKNNA